MQHASSLTNLNGKPLIVLTVDEGIDDDQQAKQDHLARLSTNSLHCQVNATHESLMSDEADAVAASKAIHDVVGSVKAPNRSARADPPSMNYDLGGGG